MNAAYRPRAPRHVVGRLVWRALAAGAIAAGVAAWYSAKLPDEFRATALLLHQSFEPGREETPSLHLAEGQSPARADRLTTMEPVSMPDFKALLESDAMAAWARERYLELLRELGDAPAYVPLEQVRSMLNVTTRVLVQTHNDVEYQDTIELNVTCTEPEVAQKLANLWAQEGVKRLREATTARRTAAADVVRNRLAAVEKQLSATEESMVSLRSAAGMDAGAAQLEGIEAALAARNLEMAELAAESDAIGAAVTSLKAQLEATPATVTLTRARRGGQYVLEETEPNPVYEKLTLALGEALREQTMLDARLQSMMATREQMQNAVAQARAARSQLSGQLAPLERKHAVLEARYDDLAATLDKVLLAADAAALELEVAAEAQTPDRPSGPMRSLMILAAALAGFFIVPVLFFTRYALDRYQGALAAGGA